MPSGRVDAAPGITTAAEANEPRIELDGVRKVFRDRGSARGADVVAVEGADLTVYDGELFAILGRRARARRRCCG